MNEALRNSRLPGRTTGPANAYQHLLWSAELTRRFGTLHAYAVLTEHELEGDWPRYLGLKALGLMEAQTAEQSEMDRHNNGIGITIGQTAKTWADVVRMARETMARSHVSGDGRGGGTVWLPGGTNEPPKDDDDQPLPRGLWNWPPRGDTLEGFNWAFPTEAYPYDDEKYRYDPIKFAPMPMTRNDRPGVDPMVLPLHAWTESDVRRVMASDAYHTPGHHDRERVHALVRVWHEATHGTGPAKRDATGRLANAASRRADAAGPVHVDAHTRRGGRVAVREHRRHRPSA